MRVIREKLRPVMNQDEGLTLIEVVVAIAIISIVATASAALVITGIATATQQERRQIAVTIASSAMETVNSRPYQEPAAGGISPLYKGRNLTNVKNAFGLYPTVPGVSNTYPIGDPAATSTSSVGLVPLSTVVPESGTNFTVATLIGSCYQSTVLSSINGVTNECGKVGSATPTGPVTNYSDLIRVIVIVTWTAGKGCASGCSYSTTSLIDPNNDLEWVTHG